MFISESLPPMLGVTVASELAWADRLAQPLGTTTAPLIEGPQTGPLRS
jgi:hypothetical protein